MKNTELKEKIIRKTDNFSKDYGAFICKNADTYSKSKVILKEHYSTVKNIPNDKNCNGYCIYYSNPSGKSSNHIEKPEHIQSFSEYCSNNNINNVYGKNMFEEMDCISDGNFITDYALKVYSNYLMDILKTLDDFNINCINISDCKITVSATDSYGNTYWVDVKKYEDNVSNDYLDCYTDAIVNNIINKYAEKNNKRDCSQNTNYILNNLFKK